jgi:hypothetical protein
MQDFARFPCPAFFPTLACAFNAGGELREKRRAQARILWQNCCNSGQLGVARNTHQRLFVDFRFSVVIGCLRAVRLTSPAQLAAGAWRLIEIEVEHAGA